jgi:hypothetical protein
MENQIIYHNKLFPIHNNKDIFNKLKIDYDSVSYISSPLYANKISKIISNYFNNKKNIIITDCTAGCGGDTISFLMKFKKVYSIEKNINRYLNLLNNILQYKLTKKSKVFCGSVINILHTITDHNVVYFDPPWGGKDYYKSTQLRLNIDDTPLEIFVQNYIQNTDFIKLPKIFVFKLPYNYDLKYFYDILNKFGKILLYNLNKMFIIILELNKKN